MASGRLQRCSSVKKLSLKTKPTKVYLYKEITPTQYTFDSEIFKFDSTLITFDRI